MRLLVTLAHDYLRELYTHVAAGDVTERIFVNALHEIRKLVTGDDAFALESRHDLTLLPALPIDLPTEGLPKLAAFYRHHRRSV